MSEVGGDLVLDEGWSYGSYETAVTDIGELAWWLIDAEFAWEQSTGGPEGINQVEIYCKVSEDNVAWGDYRPFEERVEYFRYYRFLIKVYTDTSFENVPQITRLETAVSPAASPPRRHAIINDNAGAVPGTPSVGDAYIVPSGAGGAWAGKDGQVAICVESTSGAGAGTWRFFPLREGDHVFDKNKDENYIYDGSSALRPFCLEGMRPIDHGNEVNIQNAVMQDVATATVAAGLFNDDKDKFYINVAIYTGAPPPVGGPQFSVDINDGVGWTTVWGSGALAGASYFIYHIMVERCPALNTAALACSFASNATTRTVGLAANWITNMTGIRVQAQGDTGSKASAWIFSIRGKQI
jgi:hypothetical protein